MSFTPVPRGNIALSNVTSYSRLSYRAGVNGIYGLITAIIILNNILPPAQDGTRVYSLYTAFSHMAAGLCCGLCGLASGMCIGVAGDAGVRAFTQVDYMSKQVSKSKLWERLLYAVSKGIGTNLFCN